MTATNFIELAAEAQKQALTALKNAQDLSLRATELTFSSVPSQGDLSEPFGKVPTPTEAIEGVFGFAGQVLQQQKAYALRVTELMTEASEKIAAGSELVGAKK